MAIPRRIGQVIPETCPKGSTQLSYGLTAVPKLALLITKDENTSQYIHKDSVLRASTTAAALFDAVTERFCLVQTPVFIYFPVFIEKKQ